MSVKITFFPSGNGDLTLTRLLCERPSRDAQGRRYVDAFLVSHPDKDHCTGLRKHCHMGPGMIIRCGGGRLVLRPGRGERYRVVDSGRLARRLEHRVEHGESSWRSST